MADENSFVQKIRFSADDSELVSAIERMKKELGVVNSEAGQKLSANIVKSGDEAKKTADEVGKIGKGFGKVGSEAKKAAADTRKQAEETKKAKSETDKLQGSWGKVAGAVKGAVAAYVGFQGISKLIGFGQGSIAAFNVQNRAEKMLEFGMRQNGMASRAQELKDYASAIQGRTMYGDEALLTAAGAWQNKFGSVENSKRMMDLVADFAARSTGGGAVDAGQMRGFAQQLIQSLSGRPITLKAQGFDISAIEELQRIRQKGGAVTEDMEIAALEKVLAPIKGLSSELAKTDEGKIQQLKNTIGDMREEIGRQLLPVVASFADNVRKNLPTLKGLFESLGNVFRSLVNAVSDNIGVLRSLADWIASSLNFIGNHLTEIVAFGAGMKVLGAALPLVSGGVTGLSIALKGLVVGNPLGAVAAGIASLVAVTLAASKHLRNSRDDKRYSDASVAVEAFVRKRARVLQLKREGKDWDQLSGKNVSQLEKEVIDERRSVMKAVADYANVHDGAVPQEWLDAIDMAGGFDYRSGGRTRHVYGTGPTGKVIDPKTGKEFDPGAYTYDQNALTRQIMDDVKKNAKGNTNITNIKYTNEITTDSDLMAKAIKENLRMLLTSNLSMITRSEGAKALAL